MVFLAAGALVTPTLLLNSRSTEFPNGIGNDRDLVGRNLMRHLIDFYYVKTTSSGLASGHLVDVSLSDFCRGHGYRWGQLMSTPGLMSPEIIASELVERLRTQTSLLIPRAPLKALITFILKKMTHQRILITSILEDFPEYENRILLESTPENISIQYRISKEDKLRLKDSRRYLKRLLRPLAVRLLKVAEDSTFLAHVCGTCRMATAAEDGVVDPSGKVFGVENLYVADASIFPTSGGVNPSMTIAACALKIAEQFVVRQWKS